jgi:beta-glucosidase/6-phospho-beta-glucosidase/beta-galactosidase
MTINAQYYEPWDVNEPQDYERVQRKAEFEYAWNADPIMFGRYPKSMV